MDAGQPGELPSLLVTGASGFVGRALCDEAIERGFRVKGATRTTCHFDGGAEDVVVGPIDGTTDWDPALTGIDVVIHLAARVHVMRDRATDPLSEFRRVNTAGTERLARSAAAGGVKRLIYVSSIKVNGESTQGEEQFTENSMPVPQDAYAISKWEAEQALHRVAAETGLEIVIVRPPLIYGPGVKGNFYSLLKAVDRGIPFPLARVHNARSMLYVGNLADILLRCATHPAAAGKTYLVCDGEDVSTPELVQLISAGMGKHARLFSLPLWLFRAIAAVTRQHAAFERITGSLRVNDELIRHELGWQPPYSITQGIQMTVARYME